MRDSEPELALPPLIWLRAFDAAGRSGSFKAAAEALHVTPSSISHQIKSLEDHLGQPLFKREPRQLKLTAAGRRYWLKVSAAFGQLRTASEELHRSAQPRLIRLSANPFLASEWLIPRIAAFDARFPQQALRVSVTEALEDLAQGETDFAIRFGQGQWPDVEALPLTTMTACPVMAVGADPLQLPRIDYSFGTSGSAWAVWQARGLPRIGKARGERQFTAFDAAMRATEQGLGVSLALLPLVQPWVAQGRVALVPDAPVVTVGQLYFLSRPLTPAQKTLRQVRDWWVQELRSAFSA